VGEYKDTPLLAAPISLGICILPSWEPPLCFSACEKIIPPPIKRGFGGKPPTKKGVNTGEKKGPAKFTPAGKRAWKIRGRILKKKTPEGKGQYVKMK